MSKKKKKGSNATHRNNIVFNLWKKLKKGFNGKIDIILVMFSTALAVIMKYVGYVYIAGRFSVYKIDKSYIDVNSDNVLFGVVKVSMLILLLCFVNLLYYCIGNLKKTFNKVICYILFWGIEMIAVSLYCCYSSNISILYFWKVANQSQKIVFVIVSLIACLEINIYAIFALIQKKKIKTSKSDERNVVKKRKNKKVKIVLQQVIISSIIVLILGSMMLYDLARSFERNRQDYKVIFIENEQFLDNAPIVKYNNYVICPVVYETEDYYIAIRLLYEGEGIEKDCDYQIMVPKCGQETLYVTNIYNESEYIEMYK